MNDLFESKRWTQSIFIIGLFFHDFSTNPFTWVLKNRFFWKKNVKKSQKRAVMENYIYFWCYYYIYFWFVSVSNWIVGILEGETSIIHTTRFTKRVEKGDAIHCWFWWSLQLDFFYELFINQVVVNFFYIFWKKPSKNLKRLLKYVKMEKIVKKVCTRAWRIMKNNNHISGVDVDVLHFLSWCHESFLKNWTRKMECDLPSFCWYSQPNIHIWH